MNFIHVLFLQFRLKNIMEKIDVSHWIRSFNFYGYKCSRGENDRKFKSFSGVTLEVAEEFAPFENHATQIQKKFIICFALLKKCTNTRCWFPNIQIFKAYFQKNIVVQSTFP